MNRTIYQVDAFTGQAFKGNPAAVMIIDNSVTTDFMQNIAAEMNLSETVFISAVGNDFNIRYFTPTREVPLCGHATLAAAHTVYELGLKKANETITFLAKGGKLSVTGEAGRIVMNFPQYPVTKISIPADIRKMIGFEPSEMYESSYDWKIAVAGTENEISNAAPDFSALMANDLGHLIITSKSIQPDTDFVVRCFAPTLGVNEDPVTGSAQCALTPLWSRQLGKTEMAAIQLSKRTGKLKVKLADNRVEISGQAITVFKAELKIHP